MPSLPKTGELTLLGIAFLTIMVGAVLAPGLPSIALALGVTDHASWLITIPSLGAVLFAPLAGRLIDHFSAYRCLGIGLLLYGAIGAGGVLLEGPVLVFLNRMLLGGVTALVMASGTTLISEWYQGHARLTMIAKQGMAIELGGVIFLFIGGLLASLGWQWPFTIYFMAWIFWLMFKKWIPSSAPVDEVSQTSDQAPLGQVASSLNSVYLAATISMTVFFSAFVVLPIRLQTMGFTEAQTGYLLSFISLVAVPSALAMTHLSRRLGEIWTLVLAFLFYAVAHAAFFVATEIPMLITGSICAGLGFGFSIPLVNHMTIERSHAQVRGRNLSYLTMAIFLGQFLTSFMEFLPGEPRDVFAMAGMLSLIFAVLYLALGLMRREAGKAAKTARV